MTDTTSVHIPKPRPIPTPTSQPYWDGLTRNQILVQRCADCESWVFYPRSRCTNCLSSSLEWKQVSGRGTIFTFTIARQPTVPMFADETPQLIAVVELDEGIRMTTTLVTDDLASLRTGAAVEPVFDHGADGATLLRFRITG